MLVNLLEARPWLAKGHARTSNARIRTHNAWAEISIVLNSEGSGCVKTSQQWCKYWKDKKGAVKRKSSQIMASRRRTGGGQENVPELNEIELKIQNLMGGESFASGDQHLQINPFQEEVLINRHVESEESPSILQCLVNDPPQSEQPAPQESLIEWSQSNMAVMREDNIILGSLAPPIIAMPESNHTRQENVNPVNDPPRPGSQLDVPVNDPPRPGSQPDVALQSGSETPIRQRESFRSHQHLFLRSPRGSIARRRLLRRSPPSQRRSEMVSLTERFIAIEERRAEVALILAKAISAQVEGAQAMTRAISIRAESDKAIAGAINRFSDILFNYLNT